MRILFSLCIAACVCAAPSGQSRAREASQRLSGSPQTSGPDASAAILSRIGPPSEKVLAVFVESGMKAPTDHPLTAGEKSQLKAAIAHLPPVYQSALVQHLRRLSFVDGIPGEGTGLTGSFDNPEHRYDVTFRAGVFRETLSQFLTTKENRCFSPDGSNNRILVDGGSLDAFDYVFLHEATHVLSLSSGWPVRNHNPFNLGIWSSAKQISSPYDKEVATQNIFREGGHRFKAGNAVEIYSSLARTPFVDLWATAAEEEDLASLLAFHQIWSEFHVSPKFEVQDDAGHVLYQYEPLRSPEVQSRSILIDSFLKLKA